MASELWRARDVAVYIGTEPSIAAHAFTVQPACVVGSGLAGIRGGAEPVSAEHEGEAVTPVQVLAQAQAS